MRKLTFIASYLLLALVLSMPKEVSRAQNVPGQNLESSIIKRSIETHDVEKEKRIKILEAYLSSHNSPLAPHAKTFVDEAYKNNLDWRLVAAISGVESTFGKHIPQNSYNAWGWANGKYKFQSFDEAIEIISYTLNTKYAQKWGADTPYEIGPYYAASPTWASKVTFFMNRIDANNSITQELAFNL